MKKNKNKHKTHKLKTSSQKIDHKEKENTKSSETSTISHITDTIHSLERMVKDVLNEGIQQPIFNEEHFKSKDSHSADEKK